MFGLNALKIRISKLEIKMNEVTALTAEVARSVSTMKALVDKLAAVPPSNTAEIVALTAQLKAASDAADAVLHPPAA